MGQGILALDLGLTSGWAYGTGEEPPVAGAVEFGHLRGTGKRGLAFRQWLERTLDGLNPAIVAFESAMSFSKGQNARKIIDGLGWDVEVTCEDRGFDCYETAPQKVKIHFTGHGNANKEQMMAACRRHGWTFPDHNGADALALYDFTLSRFFPEDWRRLQVGLDLLASLPRTTRSVIGT